MKYLKITNKGEIDPAAFSLVGASTKRDDNSKIGMFGSGNKYAISYFLRNKHNVIIYSGLTEINIGIKERVFRDSSFDVITINDVETSITTQMGHKWELWQAVRELYSNAIDEGLISFDLVDSIDNPSPDETSIYISTNDGIIDMFMDFDEYFLSKKREPLYYCQHGAIYAKTGTKARIYRKGIKVYETDHNALFDYDLFNIPINEDRIVTYYWNIPETIWEILYSCDNNYIIRKILENINEANLIENSYGAENSNTDKLSISWHDVLKTKQIFSKEMGGWLSDEEKLKTTFLPSWLCRKLNSIIGDIIKPKSVLSSTTGLFYKDAVIDESMSNILLDAIEFLKNCKFQNPYTIKVVDFKRTEIFGSIDKEHSIILLDIKALNKGVDFVVNTIIEEYIHLKWGVADETRGFQDAAITELISYMKLVNIS